MGYLLPKNIDQIIGESFTENIDDVGSPPSKQQQHKNGGTSNHKFRD